MFVRKIVQILLSMLLIVFPVLLYFGLNHYSPLLFAGILFLIMSLRLWFFIKKRSAHHYYMLVVIGLYCALVVVMDSALLLLYYPVLMNIYAALLFGLSLFEENNLIEQFARLAGKVVPIYAQRYMRVLTKIWVFLLMVNATASAYTACCTTVAFWALYNGVLSYLFFATFILLEIVYRAYYKRRFNEGFREHG
jgi:uncharacterized membrane protein